MRVAATLFVSLSVFYLYTGYPNLSDFRYMGALAQSLWDDGDLVLDELAAEAELPGAYQLRRHDGHLYHAFPNASAVVLAPLAGLAKVIGRPVMDDAGHYDRVWEQDLLHFAASLATAAIVAVLYLLCLQLVERKAALGIALAAALGTPLWGIGSTTLWSHTFAGLCLSIALLLQVRADVKGHPPNGLALGSLLGWMFLFRPTMAISVAALLGYAVWRWRRAVVPTALVAAAWLALFVGFNLSQWGTALPPYYQASRLLPWPLGEALLGNLVSPSRGVFVYMPALAWLIGLLVHVRRRLPLRPLVLTGAGVCVMHWWIVSSFPHWWGGRTWGPRLMMDLVPWWVFMTAAGWSALSRADADVPRPAWAHPGVAAAAVTVALLLNAIGLLHPASIRWHVDYDAHTDPDVLWDWQRAPFLHWWQKDS